MRARHVYARTARAFRARAGFLLLLGVIVFVPLGLLDALADRVREIHAEDAGGLLDLGTVVVILGLVAQAAGTVLGEVFYSGAVGLAMRQGERSPAPSLRLVARRLSYRRLIAVDILFGLGAAIGFLLLIVPGVLFFGWFALAGPIVEVEGRGVRAAFARSRQLVRGSLRTVLVVLLPILVASAILGDVLVALPQLVIHDELLRDWAGEALSNVLLSPFYAVAAVLMTLELSGRDARAERATPEAAGAAAGGTS